MDYFDDVAITHRPGDVLPPWDDGAVNLNRNGAFGETDVVKEGPDGKSVGNLTRYTIERDVHRAAPYQASAKRCRPRALAPWGAP